MRGAGVLICVSLNHRRTDFDLLGDVERHADSLSQALADPDVSAGSVVLSTCNRFEAYLDVPEVDRVDRALDRFTGITPVDPHRLRAEVEVLHDLDAASHLFSVASGLESVVVGEGEIAGQVRRALEQARSAGSTTRELERVFQLASRTSREVKRRTGLQSAGRSLVRLALAMAQSRIGDWGTASVVLIGTGTYAGASLAALRARGAGNVRVFSPSGRAEAFARARGIGAIGDGELEGAVADADLVITASLAQEPILTADLFARTARPARGPYCASRDGRAVVPTPFTARPRLVIDLGLPRNVAPDVALVSGVELLDLDTIAKHAPLEELSAKAEARGIVDDAVREFAARRAEHDAIPALVALRGHVHGILDDELERLRGLRTDERASGDAETAHAAAVEAALRHFAGRLLHTPSTRIRHLGRSGEAERAMSAVESLFGVRDGDDRSG